MKKLIIVFATTVLVCNSNLSKVVPPLSTKRSETLIDSAKHNICKETMLTDGVLRIKTDGLQEKKDTIFIYNDDSTLFGKIYSENESEEPVFIGQVSLNIRAYYPDNYIIVLDSDQRSDGKYQVVINGSKKYIPHMEEITLYEDWKTHVKTSFIATDNTNPL